MKSRNQKEPPSSSSVATSARARASSSHLGSCQFPAVLSRGATVQTQLTKVQAISSTRLAFAAIKADGSVVTWGRKGDGGDSSAVQQQLTAVSSISSTHHAFAAITADGSVVTWGLEGGGGDSSAVQQQLTDVSSISSAGEGAFAAIKVDGSVVTWGKRDGGGDSSAEPLGKAPKRRSALAFADATNQSNAKKPREGVNASQPLVPGIQDHAGAS